MGKCFYENVEDLAQVVKGGVILARCPKQLCINVQLEWEVRAKLN